MYHKGTCHHRMRSRGLQRPELFQSNFKFKFETEQNPTDKKIKEEEKTNEQTNEEMNLLFKLSNYSFTCFYLILFLCKERGRERESGEKGGGLF